MATSDATSAQTTHRWRWWVHLILIGGFFLPFVLFSHERAGPSLGNNTRDLLTSSATNIGVFALVFGVAWLISRASSDQMFLLWRPGWWVAPLGLAYSLLIRLFVGIVAIGVVAVLLATKVVTQETLQQLSPTKMVDVGKIVDVSAMQHQPPYFWLTVTLVSFVVAGLREELWRAGTLAAMRALWPRLFATRAGEIVAVAIIAVGFGAAHIVMGPIAAILAGLLGFLLGLIIIFHRSIWPAVIAHGCFDALSFALLPLVLGKLQHLT
ncbi:MAG: CPBP family intramembrane glutamic endopeptidase [Chthoniobacterales bacterium]